MWIGIIQRVRGGEGIPETLEPGQSITRSPEQLTDAVHGFLGRKSIVFVKPMATCAEAPPNTNEHPTTFYGTNVNISSSISISNPIVLMSIPLTPPAPPITTTSQTSNSRSNSSRIMRFRRTRPNPFNQIQRSTISNRHGLSRYRYTSDEARSEQASANNSNTDTDSVDSASSYNFDPEY